MKKVERNSLSVVVIILCSYSALPCWGVLTKVLHRDTTATGQRVLVDYELHSVEGNDLYQDDMWTCPSVWLVGCLDVWICDQQI